MQQTPEVIGKQVKVELTFPDGLQSHFVSVFTVQSQPEIITLCFFEAWQPTILGDPAEKEAQLAEVDHVEAKCVARLVVTPSKLKEIAVVMAEGVRNYEQLMQSLAKAERGK
jgi:hypothetical protein